MHAQLGSIKNLVLQTPNFSAKAATATNHFIDLEIPAIDLGSLINLEIPAIDSGSRWGHSSRLSWDLASSGCWRKAAASKASQWRKTSLCRPLQLPQQPCHLLLVILLLFSIHGSLSSKCLCRSHSSLNIHSTRTGNLKDLHLHRNRPSVV